MFKQLSLRSLYKIRTQEEALLNDPEFAIDHEVIRDTLGRLNQIIATKEQDLPDDHYMELASPLGSLTTHEFETWMSKEALVDKGSLLVVKSPDLVGTRVVTRAYVSRQGHLVLEIMSTADLANSGS